MPLLKGTSHIISNVKELLTGPISPARRKAINTIAKKHGISFSEARRKQALAIGKTLI